LTGLSHINVGVERRVAALRCKAAQRASALRRNAGMCPRRTTC
jgi:hypothetical protein